MNRVFLWILSGMMIFLSSCGTGKQTTVSKKKKKEIQKKETVLFQQSDIVFNDFKKKSAKKLNKNTLNYIDTYKHIAIEKMMEHGIPASITLAQGILESGNGLSELSRKSNNHFGIKCHKGWDGKKVRYDDDKKRECFRKYNSPERSFEDHSTFLTSRSRYGDLFKLPIHNYKAWARGLKKAGYATDRKYPGKLISIIEDYHLYDYDAIVIKQRKYLRKGPYKEESISGYEKMDQFIKENNRKRSLTQNGKRKYIIVNSGDTLYSIAKNNRTTIEKLKKINSLDSNHIRVGQKLFLK